MPLATNSKGIARARSLIAAGKVNDGAWSFSAEDGNKLLGPDGDDWAAYAAVHLAVDPDAPEKTKAHYKYPCIKGSEVYRRGVAAAESRAAQNGADAVAAAAKKLMEAIQKRDDDGKDGPAIERKMLDFEVKDFSDSGNGSASFYFAAFNNVDRANERILPGAFKNLDEFLRDGFIAIGHDWSRLPIGIPTSAVQDGKGLLVGFNFHSTPEAQAARAVMKERLQAGKNVKGSIGYEVLEDAQVDGVRELKSLALYEGSLVNVPCNPLADAVTVKGLKPREAKYYGDYGYASPYDPDPAFDAATSAVCALNSGLMRTICSALMDDRTPKAEKLATLRDAFDEFSTAALRVIDALMDDEVASTAAAKAFGRLALATKALPKPETKAGRTISAANLKALSACYETMGMQLDAMSGTHAELKDAHAALGSFIAIHAPSPMGGTADDPDDDGDDDGVADARLAETVGFPVPAPAGLPEPGKAHADQTNHTNQGATKGMADSAGLVARSEETVAAFAEILTALTKQHATRTAEGRSLSPAKWDALKGLIDEATALLAVRPASPPDEEATAAAAGPALDEAEIYRQYAEAMELV